MLCVPGSGLRKCGVTAACALVESPRNVTMAEDLIAMFASITTSDHDALVAQFSKVLQIDSNVAQFFLESSSWNVEAAINTFLASVGNKANLLRVSNPPKGVLTLQPEFVSGQRVPPGAQRLVMMHIRNTGTAPWPADTCVAFQEGSRLRSHPQRMPPLDPGQEQFVGVDIKCPTRPGDHLSCYRVRYEGGFITEPVWIMLTVDPKLPPEAPAARVSHAAPVVMGLQQGTHPRGVPAPAAAAAPLSSSAASVALPPTHIPAAPAAAMPAAAVAAAAPSIFAPSSFSAPSTTAATPATPATPFTFTGFAQPPSSGGAAQAPAASSMPMFGTSGFSFGAAAPAPGGPATDGDDAMMD